MGITRIHYCYFVVWIMKDLLVKKVTYNEKLAKRKNKFSDFL